MLGNIHPCHIPLFVREYSPLSYSSICEGIFTIVIFPKMLGNIHPCYISLYGMENLPLSHSSICEGILTPRHIPLFVREY